MAGLNYFQFLVDLGLAGRYIGVLKGWSPPFSSVSLSEDAPQMLRVYIAGPAALGRVHVAAKIVEQTLRGAFGSPFLFGASV